ncbi:DUF6777 domain-containing protein [Streptomyces sp. NPDC059008]|uniref:DUF6777 domain-containing protein n=1 Tax=unclassified Streptomyces TaxID=2593676 RepID=UPI0036AA998F
MTSPPSPDSRPTGPPAGPLTPSDTPSDTPHEPTRVDTPQPRTEAGGPPPPPRGPGKGGGGGGGGGGEPGGGGPWWRSAPRVAIIAAAVVAAVILTLVLTRPDGAGTAEIFAEPAGSTGRDPVTASTATESGPTPSETPRKPVKGTNSNISGAMPGLYGGTQNSASCDIEKQIRYLGSVPAKNRAFAAVVGQAPENIPAYLRSLTPVQLRYDTRVTNHGYKDDKAYPFQSVLQAGTAVLVDSYGVPRVRCKCGNPLTKPKALTGARTVGQKWAGYQPSNAVVVKPSKRTVRSFTLCDPKTGKWFKRPKGAEGPTGDRPTAPPSETPSGPTAESPSTESSPPTESTTGETGTATSEPGTPDTGPGTETTGGTGTNGGTGTTGGTTEPPPGGTTGDTSPHVEQPGEGTPGSNGSPGGEPHSEGTAPAT